jgi:hypothetical protein
MLHIEQTWHHISHSHHPLSRPTRLLVVVDIFYIGTSILTNIPAKFSMPFMAVAIAIDQLVMPKFVELLEPYCDVSGVPLLVHVVHIQASLLIAKAICSLFSIALSWKQIYALGAIYWVSIHVTRLLYKKIKHKQIDPL